MDDEEPRFYEFFESNVKAAFRELLAQKHLYQSVRLDTAYIKEIASKRHHWFALRDASSMSPNRQPLPPLESFEAEGLELTIEKKWSPQIPNRIYSPFSNQREGLEFELPSIKLFCAGCKENEPHHACHVVYQDGAHMPSDQWFLVNYECQGCKGDPVRFLIRRKADKLTLCGREPIEEVRAPSTIPKNQATFYKSAVIAFQSGQTLAAIFLLRVFVEQYWKSHRNLVSELESDRPTGEELGAAYRKTLPPEFNSQFPSLSDVYEDLSGAMHSAQADDASFLKCLSKTDLHFEAIDLFKKAKNIVPSNKSPSDKTL